MSVEKTRRSSWFVILLTLLVTFQIATPAWAWGTLGHRVIAQLAEKHMTPQAKAAVAALLDPGESIADASLWADVHRGQLRKTAPWHYVDVPLDEPKYDRKWSADDPKHGCVVDMINEFRLVVKDKSKTIEERRFALRFLLHCVQDMHQPLPRRRQPRSRAVRIQPSSFRRPTAYSAHFGTRTSMPSMPSMCRV